MAAPSPNKTPTPTLCVRVPASVNAQVQTMAKSTTFTNCRVKLGV
jgi:hypothetical protein